MWATIFVGFGATVIGVLIGVGITEDRAAEGRARIVAAADERREQICDADAKQLLVLHNSLHLLTTDERIATIPQIAEVHDEFHAILDDAVPDFCRLDPDEILEPPPLNGP